MNMSRDRSLGTVRSRKVPAAARLTREAERLLGELAAEGAYALADPIEPDC